MIKATTIIIGVILVLLIGTCIYFVAGVSSTYPPLKEYNYSGNFSHLKKNLNKLSATDGNLTYQITDTTGSKKTGYDYYVSIKLKSRSRDVEYEIVYQKTVYWFKKDITEIGLVLAYDKIHNTGGYGYGRNANDAKVVKELIGLFENEILPRLLQN